MRRPARGASLTIVGMLHAQFELYRIKCNNDGEAGEGEPYLWTAFFKLDRTVITQRADAPFRLAGTPEFHFGTGSHGNLGTEGMTYPDVRAIKPHVGRFVTDLTTLDLTNPITGDAIPAPGVIGVIAVLMEENGVSDHGAEAAHQAFNQFAREQVTTFIADLDLLQVKLAADALMASDPTLSSSDALIKALSDMVSAFATTLRDQAAGVLIGAIADDQNIFENLAAHFDPDGVIDVQVMLGTTDDLARNANKFEFQREFLEYAWSVQGGGGWDPGPKRYQMYGRMTGTPVTVPVVAGTVPAGSHVEISCTRKAYSRDHHVWFITQVGGIDHGSPWLLGKGKVVQLIEAGTKSFFVRAPDGHETPVIVSHLDDGRPYLTTPATNFTEDNLSALPWCPNAVVVEDD